MLLLGLLALCCGTLLRPASGIPIASFYSFGSEANDSQLSNNDDGSSSPISLSSPFPFFASSHTTLFVNNNGVISFDVPVTTFTPLSFPLSGDLQLIAPFWGDVDTRGGSGRVWYRDASSDGTLLMRARNEIRMVSVSHMTFQPTFLFIATWDAVGYFGGASSTLRNTFQCLLVSDGRRSFVIFLYADGLIQWTTGTASGGAGGLGGTEAQVGFNAGDGVRSASVPGSQTPSIISIDRTSNVGRNGVWLFRVDEEEIIVSSACNNSAPLQIAPRVGNTLGGTAILLAGPCFNTSDDILCTFDGFEVLGSYISEVLAVCVSPYFQRKGWKELTVTLWTGLDMRYSGENRFYAVSFEDSADIGFTQLSGRSFTPSPTFHFTSDSLLSVTWDPDSLIPMTDPASFRVDIALSQMSLETGRFERLQTLAANLANSGSAEVVFPSSLSPRNITEVIIAPDTRPVAIEVVVSSLPSFRETQPERERRQALFPVIVRGVKRWSPVLFFTSIATSLAFRGACELWRERQRSGIGNEILSRLPPCPRRVFEARAVNSGFREDVGVARFLSRHFFHRGAATCFRQTVFTSSNMRSGQQCCYDEDGNLATNAPAGGTVDLISPEISPTEHFIEDVLPSIACCFGIFPNCEGYYEHRPSDDGSRYNPPPPACVYGDPHIVTLDGFKYTFNGLGEYCLIDTPGNQFTLQGRMEVPMGGTLPSDITATVFTAIVAKEVASDTVQFQLTADGQSLEMLMNGIVVDFSELAEQEFTNVVVYDPGNNTLAATFSSGVYLEVRAQNGFLSTLLLSLSQNYQGMTAGLMGNYNGNTEDDLLPLGGLMGLPLTSSLEDIHFMFGVTWIISRPQDSLFTYSQGTSFSTFHNPLFTPTFTTTFTDPALEVRALAICGDDRFCLFDIAATGSTEIGLSTLMGDIEFQTIVNRSLPVTCFPPCENGVCVSDDVCICSSGFQGPRCEDSVFTECAVNPCENGGSCRMRAGSYICNCPFGFSGLQCQMEDSVDSGSGLFGSGGSLMDICMCRREVECSIAGAFNPQRTSVIPTGPNLQCVYDFPGSRSSEQDMLSGGSGFDISPFAIDNTFNVNFLSAGSYSFLRTVGVIPRDAGATSCTLQDSLQSQESLTDALGMEQISLIFQRDGGEFDSISLNMYSVTQIIQSGDFTIGGQLDAVQSCSFQYLLDSLSRPPSRSFFSCRNTVDSDLSTVLTFTVSCG